MGMYTQLHIGTRLRKDITQEQKNILDFMIGNSDIQPIIKETRYELFQLSDQRWCHMLQCDSYYFDYKTTGLFKFDNIAQCYWFNVTCNLKNYQDEIKHFLNFLYHLIEDDIKESTLIGYWRYEENDYPVLIFKGNMVSS